MKLTPEQIAEIEKRTNAATDGPWVRDNWNDTDIQVIAHGNEVIVYHHRHHRQCNGQVVLNHTFIAQARTDIPALISHIRAVEAERDAAVEGLREELKIVNAKNSGRTHYAGCEENHTLCAVARRLDAALKSAGAEP